MDNNAIKDYIKSGKAILGIELGSTRIKSVLIGEDYSILAEGGHTWENRLLNGHWTYSLEDTWTGLQESYRNLVSTVRKEYGVQITDLAAIGISAMMHGYLVFDANENLLVPFRTWRNVTTKESAEFLTDLFDYNIPMRWSIAHLYQAILNREEHVDQIRYMTTLAQYVHWKLTGSYVIGVGDASGMFPIDVETGDYDQRMINQFNALENVKGYSWSIEEIMPKPVMAGDYAGELTREGALLLDPSGNLKPGAVFCPAEGDAQTGMIATNSLSERTGNISAGTSDFAILVLERPLSRVYTEIDLVTSPTGKPAANIHCNNCSSDIDAWAGIFREFANAIGSNISSNELYTALFEMALKGEADAGGLLSYNYFSGEGITDIEQGRPMVVRKPENRFTLANFMRMHLYSAVATLKLGMDVITVQEGMQYDRIMGHGGFFKTEKVGQSIMAAALNSPITVAETANFGGAWGIALLAAYMQHKDKISLEEWVETDVFRNIESTTVYAETEEIEGFKLFLKQYLKCFKIERTAVELMD